MGDPETMAMSKIAALMEPLDAAARSRVLDYLNRRFHSDSAALSLAKAIIDHPQAAREVTTPKGKCGTCGASYQNHGWKNHPFLEVTPVALTAASEDREENRR